MKVIKALRRTNCGIYWHEEEHEILVDDDRYEVLSKYKWHVRKDGNTFYASTKIDKVYTLMHHMVVGCPIKPYVTDHVDNNGINNQEHNMSIVTHRKNLQNIRSSSKSSKYPGVSWYTRHQKWIAGITINKKSTFLGYFNSEEDAYTAYKSKLKCCNLE